MLCAPHTHMNVFIDPLIVLPMLQGCRLSASPSNSRPHSSAACVTIFPNGLGAPCRQGVYTCPSSKIQAQPWPLTPSPPRPPYSQA